MPVVIDNESIFDIYQVYTGGLRNEEELTQKQFVEAVQYAEKLGMPRQNIGLTSGNTRYGAELGVLLIGTDLLPLSERSDNPNSNISWRGTLAHEIVGHKEACEAGRALLTSEDMLMARNGELSKEEVYYKEALDEAQASVRAAKFAPDLSDIERQDLMDDAIARLSKRNIVYKDVTSKLYLEKR